MASQKHSSKIYDEKHISPIFTPVFLFDWASKIKAGDKFIGKRVLFNKVKKIF